MNEKVIEIVDGLELYGVTALIRYVAVFTNQRVIFLKTAGNWTQALFGVVSELASKMKNEDALAQLKMMSADQIAAANYDKVIVTKAELGGVELSEWPIIFRSKVVVNQGGKKYKFKMTKGVFKKFQQMFNALLSGAAETMASSQVSAPSYANVEQPQQKNLGIKIIGILVIIIAALSILGALGNSDIIGIVRGVLLLVVGILLVKMKRWGFYILSFLFFVNLAQLFSGLSSAKSGEIATYLVVLVILGAMVAYVWSQRKKLA